MTGGREVTEAEMDIKQWKRWMERRESGVGGLRQNWGKERVTVQR